MIDFDPERMLRSPFLSGAVGSIVALRYVPGTRWLERLFNVITGSLTAGYIAPALIEWLHLRSEGMANASAFVVGLLGMSFIAAAIQAIKELRLAEIVSRWLSPRQ